MIFILFLLSTCMSTFLCKEDIYVVTTMEACQTIIEIDSKYIGPNGPLSGACLQEDNHYFSIFTTPDNQNLLFITTSSDSQCQSSGTPHGVAHSDTFDVSKAVIKATIKGSVPVAPVAPVNNLKEVDLENLAYLYVIENVCFDKYTFVKSQFGVASHLFDEDGCKGSHSLSEIFTNSYKGMSAEVTKVILDEGAEYTLGATNTNVVIVEPVLTTYEINEETEKIIEMISKNEGFVYTQNQYDSFVVDETKTLKLIDSTGHIATGSKCANEDCSSTKGKLYLFPVCSNKVISSVIGDLVVIITNEDDSCQQPVSVVVSKNSILKLYDTEYLLKYTSIVSEGALYKKITDNECDIYKFGKCLKTSETSSKKIEKSSDGKIVLETFTSPDCSTGLSIAYIEGTEDSNPFDGSIATLIESTTECDVKDPQNSVISKQIKLDKCVSNSKYIVEKEEVVKYSYENLEKCESNTSGTKDEQNIIKCGQCSSAKYAVCPEIEESSSNSSSGNNTDDDKEDESSNSILIFTTLAVVLMAIII